MSFGMFYNVFKTQHRGHTAFAQPTKQEDHQRTDRQEQQCQFEAPHTEEEIADLVKQIMDSRARSRAMKVQRWGMLLYTEFRYVIITVLLVVAALTLQQTIEDALDTFVRSRFESKGMRIAWMFLFSLIIILVVIVIVMLWPPAKIPDAELDPDLEALIRQKLCKKQEAASANNS